MALKITLWIIAAILMAALLLFLLLLSWSPGKTEPFRDEAGNVLPGSVSERVTVRINGFEQGMILQGESEDNPVLLFLHGGPGNPEFVLTKNYDIGLEADFTVCWWDQKGGGMSYARDIDGETMTLEAMVADTVAVTDYLRKRFGVEKIYLMGHSWGSFLGMNVAAQYPERYHAYIGIGQVVDQLESEKLSYEAMVAYADQTGDGKLAAKLAQYTLDSAEDVSTKYLMLRSDTLTKMGGGVFHEEKSKWKDMLYPVLSAREYTLSDKYGFAMGSLESLSYPIQHTQMTTDLRTTIPAVEVPVYIFHGQYDLQVSYELANVYYAMLEAPKKGFYTFVNSAHSPFMEEPERFMEIIRRDVLGAE